MKSILHKIYVLNGILINNILLLYWHVRDKYSPPSTDAVLFVAHPDDDTLFFHTFIKEHKPYVCLMTTGWSLRRIPDFFKCMRQYGVRYRVYPLDSKDKRIHLLEKQVGEVLSIKQFSIIATHNASGEYGHEEHIRVHQAVVNAVENKADVFCPVEKEQIQKYPLEESIVKEKMHIFEKIYVTESWVPYDELCGTPVWVTHEKLVLENISNKEDTVAFI